MAILNFLTTTKNYLTNLNSYLGLITFIVVLWAVYTFLKQKKDRKRDIAKLILQEIRYAERKVRHYVEFPEAGYKFYSKLVPTNNWYSNIHLFLEDFEETEIDLISDFYSKTSFLDTVITTIYNQRVNPQMVPITTPVATPNKPDSPGGGLQSSVKFVPIPLTESSKMLALVSKDVEFLYNSPIASKLKSISDKKWYQML